MRMSLLIYRSLSILGSVGYKLAKLLKLTSYTCTCYCNMYHTFLPCVKLSPSPHCPTPHVCGVLCVCVCVCAYVYVCVCVSSPVSMQGYGHSQPVVDHSIGVNQSDGNQTK